jgi:hypothetical protein
MSPKTFVVASVLTSFLSAIAGTAHAQAPAPPQAAQPPPPQYPPPQYPPGQAPPQGYPHPAQYGGEPRYYPPQPPPASAVAPNGEYVAPLSQTTQPTYVPQSVALSGPRMIKDWEPGTPIPHGYHAETRVRKGKVISGSIVFGVTYLYSSFIAAIGQDISSETGDDHGLGWLFIPVLGPFLEMMETDSTTAHYILALDGIAQAAGVTLLVTGLMYPKWVLVRNDLASATVVPMKIGMDGSGFGLVGRF